MSAARAAPRGRPELRRLALGVALLAAILGGQQLFGIMTSDRRLDPALRGAQAPVDVVVVLAFQPERFHNERLAQYGVFAGRDHAINRIRLQHVSPENLRGLANLAWVERVEAPRPP
jgi:hypothetical protein